MIQEKNNMQSERFKNRIILNVDVPRHRSGTKRSTEESCLQNSSSVAACAAKFPTGHGHSFGLGSEGKWHATLAHKPSGSWNRVAEQKMLTFGESGHPAFRGTSALARGPFFSKGAEEHRCNGRLQTYHCTSLSPSIGSMSTEPQRIGAKILLSESLLILS